MPYSEEERRQRKNARQREYAKRTGWATTNRAHNENTKMIGIRMSLQNDKDILDFLDQLDNKSGYVKELIRSDMKKRGLEILDK